MYHPSNRSPEEHLEDLCAPAAPLLQPLLQLVCLATQLQLPGAVRTVSADVLSSCTPLHAARYIDAVSASADTLRLIGSRNPGDSNIYSVILHLDDVLPGEAAFVDRQDVAAVHEEIIKIEIQLGISRGVHIGDIKDWLELTSYPFSINKEALNIIRRFHTTYTPKVPAVPAVLSMTIYLAPNSYPHTCLKCGSPAYIGMNSIDCSNSGCNS